jgi:preprotein translocase subunit SecE
MGFDPNRPHRNTTTDYVLVVAAFVLVAGLVLWAVVGL